MPWLTQIMEWKLKPVVPLEETSLGKVSVSPSRTIWPAPWTLLLFMVGTLPLPQHHLPGLQESARWLPLVSFLSKQSLASPLNPFLDFTSESSERTIAWGLGHPHKDAYRMVKPWLA